MTVDLSTTYLGLKLPNPLVVSACPLTGELDVLRRLEEFGAAAAVMPSLFEEQLEHKTAEMHASESPAATIESAAYFHELKEYNRGPAAYLKHITSAKQAVSIPIIGSLNATTLGPWIEYAREIESAGADALELNVYFLVTDLNTSSADVEARYLELIAAVRGQISIPMAVKLGPYFTALPSFARRAVEAGANGLVLFNRFLQPDIDLNTMRVVPRYLSAPDELRVPLRWIGLLRDRVHCSLAASTGAHFTDDVIKLLLAGADVVMVASTLYRHGVSVLDTLINGVGGWLDSNEYFSVEQIKGILSRRKSADPAAFERANYTKALASFIDSGIPSNPSV